MRQYLELLQHIIDRGVRKGDRTGTGTISVFGRTMRFDLREGFPLVTTKKLFTRGIIEELLMFIRGSTDNTELEAKKVGIWDAWALKEDVTKEVRLSNYERACLLAERKAISVAEAQTLLNSKDAARRTDPTAVNGLEYLDQEGIPTTRTEVVIKRGELGPIYGAQWRRWKMLDGSEHDQLGEAIHLLKTKPNSRRIVITAWNPQDLPDESVSPQENVRNGKQALASCHCMFQFYTAPMEIWERIELHNELHGENQHLQKLYKDWQDYLHTAETGKEVDTRCDEVNALATSILDARGVPKLRLSCHLTQRSCDVFLGVPFNIASYALLTHMVAQVCGMTVGDFVWTGGDVHIYNNLIDQVNQQLPREPRALPKLLLNPDVKNIDDFRIEDFKIVGYDPWPAIKGEVAV